MKLGKNVKMFVCRIQGVMVGFDWDWEFKVVEVNLFIVSFTFLYGKTIYDEFIDCICDCKTRV